MIVEKNIEKIIRLENQNKSLKALLDKANADKDYIAMMTGIDIPEEQRENE